MEEAKGQSILDKMLTTFINTLVKAAENEAQTHFGKNLEEVLKHFMAKVNSDFENRFDTLKNITRWGILFYPVY